jgi:Uma2 family endonuclease
MPPYKVRSRPDLDGLGAHPTVVALLRCRDQLHDRLGAALGEPRISIGPAEAALRWRNGGFIECSLQSGCRWLIVDPSAVEPPEQGVGDTAALSMSIDDLTARWAYITDRLPSYEAYLDLERRTPLKVEFADGRIYVMAGGTLRHAAVGTNAIVLLGGQLRGRCRVLGSDAKLWIPKFKSTRYPDVMVVCGDLQTTDRDRNALVNPVLLVEVISPGTETVDRSEKLEEYKSIPTLRHYLLVDSEERRVEVYSKRTRWLKHARLFGSEDTITLTDPDLTLVISELYADSGVPEPAVSNPPAGG